MTDASFKPAGAAFAALVAGLAPAAEAADFMSAQADEAAKAAEFERAQEAFAAGLRAIPALEPLSAPAEAARADADVPMSGFDEG